MRAFIAPDICPTCKHLHRLGEARYTCDGCGKVWSPTEGAPAYWRPDSDGWVEVEVEDGTSRDLCRDCLLSLVRR